jgi:hypothetical protein
MREKGLVLTAIIINFTSNLTSIGGVCYDKKKINFLILTPSSVSVIRHVTFS